ncbi:MAG: hypothetical protein ABIG96_01635 [Candidatus Micrarchaeota archaeon]
MMLKAQSAAEYVTLMALVFVLVASLMLVAFRQQEANLALSSARISCMEYSGRNSSIACYEMRYYYTGPQNITIVPVSDVVAQYQRDELTAIMVENWGQIFKPGTTPAGKCLTAAYYSYCVAFP